MEIKVVGGGCANCKKLFGYVKKAIGDLDMDADILYMTDMADIAKTGIMQTPGLVIDGKVKAMGRVPGVNEIKQMIKDEQ